jgi:hypothetical protein
MGGALHVSDGRGSWYLRHFDLLSTVLLALAAVATAWASYQGGHWRGEQGLAGNRSTAARVEANRAAGVANRQIQNDALVFTQWVDAYSAADARLTAFYFRRFRPEFRPAVSAWIATRPLVNPDAPLTPFEMPQYRSAALARADRLEAKGDVQSAVAQGHLNRADRYTLGVVLFATSLLFAGISTRLGTERSRGAVLAMGWMIFTVTLVWMATYPAHLGV